MFDSRLTGRNNWIAEILPIFIALLCVSLVLQSLADHKYVLKELNYLSSPYYDPKGIAKAAVYLISYAASIGFILLVTIQRSRVLWVVSVAYILTAYVIDASSQFIVSRSGFTHFQYALFLNEADNAKNLIVFWSEISMGLLAGGVLFAILFGLRTVARTKVSPRWLLAVPVFFLPVIVAKLGVHYVTYASYPAPVKLPLIIANYHLTTVEQPPRVLAADVLPGQSKTDNLVLIVDESISGTHLTINGYDRNTTPDLEEFVKRGAIANFGVVNSTGNCSALSNLTLRIGLSSETEGAAANFVAMRRSLPTIYQYAKRAGYKTWLIDAQVKEGTMTNHLTYDDLKYVDEYFTNSSRIEDDKRDLTGLEKLKTVLKQDAAKKKLIVFVKDGAHWPYLWRFPRDKAIFSPVQSTEYEPRTIENKDKLLNTYGNVVRYAVNDFLKRYLTEVNLNNVLTFYTSDHGQTFLEPDAKDTLTHCSSFYDPASSQVAVPLLVIESSPSKRYTPEAGKIYSQHQIFPSMLSEMGYSNGTVGRYGNTLLQGYPPNHQRWFYWSMEGDRSLYKPKAALSGGAQAK